MIRTIIISLFLLSTIFGFSQKNNLKISAVVLPGYQGFSLGYERKILKKFSISLQGGVYHISWFDYSSIDPVGHPNRTDLRLHFDFRKYLVEEKAEKLYGPFLFIYFAIVKLDEDVEEPWLYEPPKYTYIDYKYTAGIGIGNKSKISKKSNIFLEYGLAPGFGYIKGNTNDYYHFEIRILVALCLGL